MNTFRLILLGSLVLVLRPAEAGAQYSATTIETILTNPEKFSEQAVEVSGTATLYAAASPTTGHFLLKGVSGSAIRVNTTEGSPELAKKYRVSGIVYLDPSTRIPFISEKARAREDLPVQTPPGQVAGEEEGMQWFWFAPIIVVLVLAAAVTVARRRRSSIPQEVAATMPEPAPVKEESPAPAKEVPPPPEPASDLKTVRITLPSAMTMKYVPGELVVLSGEDKGKSFKIAGYPTAEGSVVTLGREAVTDERAYAHIQIEERFHTVSRKQAELIWKSKRLFVKNLSDTNPTQVNGIVVKPGKMVQLKPGSVMRTGELEFEYRT